MQTTVFNKKNVGSLRAVFIDNEPYFSADDISKIFMTESEYDHIMCNCIEEDDKTEILIGGETTTVINTSGVYTAIYFCSVFEDEIASFKKWFAGEILPAMRAKTDGVSLESLLNNPEFIITVFKKLQSEIDSRKAAEDQKSALIIENTSLKTENAKMKRQSEIAANIDSDKILSTSEIAREYGKPATWLNGILSELFVQFRENGRWVISDEFKDDGYVKYVPMTFGGRKMPKFTINHMYWTYKGKQFIYNLLKGDGILPLDEQETMEAENNE